MLSAEGIVVTKKHQGKKLGDFLSISLPEACEGLMIYGLSQDSRLVGEGDLYIAIPGLHVDGREFIENAFDRGAVVVLAEAEGLDGFSAASLFNNVVSVPQLAQRIGEISSRFFDNPSKKVHVTAVTGTNGKSTVTQLLAQINSYLGSKSAVVGTLGYGSIGALESTAHTTPTAIEMQRILADLVVDGFSEVAVEASSHGLEQERLSSVDVDMAVFTNLSQDHLDYHKSIQAYFNAKKKLFLNPNIKYGVINWDDSYGKQLFAEIESIVGAVWRYSCEDASAELFAKNIAYSAGGITAEIVSPVGVGMLQVPLIGQFNLENVLACVSALLIGGAALSDVLNALPKLKPVPGRMEVLTGSESATVIVDYAHTPDALKVVLTALRRHCEGELWCVFGCGGDRDKGKRPQMGEIAIQLADHIIVTTDNPRSEDAGDIIRQVVDSLEEKDELHVIEARDQAITKAIEQSKPGDVVLIAGKGHEDYQEIDGCRLPFSDVKCARLALANVLNKQRSDGGAA